MGRDLAEQFPAARDTFDEADEALGIGISRLCWEGPESELTLTVNAQPAILVHSVAVWRVLAENGTLDVAMGAGHSLGEFSVYVTAGSLAFPDAVRIVRRRGELMYDSGLARPGTMAAVLGLEDSRAEVLCREASSNADGVVVAANLNSPGQLVLSGDVKAVERAAELARSAGARRVVTLNVSGAFHSPLMETALDGLRQTLDKFPFGDPSFPIISNVTAEPVSDAETARDLLLRQLVSPVRWADSIRTMRAAGVETFVEIGPGNVLAGLLRRIDREATGIALGTAGDLQKHIAEVE
ncbi:MAG: ACP S-malonyltransferase [Gemmatimonas sp.]|nr:ACP S-malonyltransferase [Gemmatimonas sp.]